MVIWAGLKIAEQPRQHIKKQTHYLANKGPSSQSYGFSSSHVWMWELDHKGSALKNWCFWTVVLERMLESLLDCKIKPVNPKGNQFWIFIGSTEAEAEAPILATWCEELTHWKRPRCWQRLKVEGGNRGQDGWIHHQLNEHEFEQVLGDAEGQGSLPCCSPWGRKKSDKTKPLNKAER